MVYNRIQEDYWKTKRKLVKKSKYEAPDKSPMIQFYNYKNEKVAFYSTYEN